ncbi:MAG: hypothetical protein RLO80_13175 [Hyphomonas sp.]
MLNDIEPEDVYLISRILEKEKVSHKRISMVCFLLFLISFGILISALCFFAYTISVSGSSQLLDSSLGLVQVIATLAAMMIGSFVSWCAARTCVNSIERSLLAAEAGRFKLFTGFVRDLECTSKKKRSVLIDVASSMFT